MQGAGFIIMSHALRLSAFLGPLLAIIVPAGVAMQSIDGKPGASATVA
jgi:hypothetical protein